MENLSATHSHSQFSPGKSATPVWALIDEDGFLLEQEIWTPNFTKVVAEAEGITELTQAHWSVIYFLRNYFESFGGLPSMRRVCRSQQLSRHEVGTMFNSCLSAWKMAGLPNPGEEAKTYMS